MRRRSFALAAFAACVAPHAASASGGFEADDGLAVPTEIRVLVAADRAGRMPASTDAQSFTFDGKRYRGVASVAILEGREALVAHVGLDAYLAGVVPLEASAGWPRAALEAQAIVARTFVLARRSAGRAYDVVAGDRDQLYGGIGIEAPAVTAAVNATTGQVIASDGAPAAVFFSACCGGHTASSAETWGGAPLPYLAGVPDPHCAAAPDYRWRQEYPIARVEAALGAKLGGVAIRDARIDARDSSGRARTVTFSDGTHRAALSGAELRARLGAASLRSTLLARIAVDTTQAGSVVAVEGGGRGHGVGLCQWGTRAMAADGADARDILAFYFPGTTVTRG
jgi:stage II sporulation protein D